MSDNKTEDRAQYYKWADEWEEDFVLKYGAQFNIIINPAKAKAKTAPDLYMLKKHTSADLKSLQKPFYKSQQKWGIPAQHSWQINWSDLFEYSLKHPDQFGIFIWKRFKDSEKYGVKVYAEEAVYYTSLFLLKSIVARSGKLHKYIRRRNDTNGNSIDSFIVDLRRLKNITHIYDHD
jgi:hypothetical protein